MSEARLPLTPYKGLVPYAEEDAPFFFGRDPEQEIITANLMGSRLTLLYGLSGAGKSSVLHAGVAHHLRELARRNLAQYGEPEFAVVVFNEWRDDPLARLAAQIQASVAQALNGQAPESEPTPSDFIDLLQSYTERVGGRLLIILDQFEEYFLYHAQEDGAGTFAAEFPRAVNDPDLLISFIISIREDALAKLDRFEGRVPRLFDNYLRIEHLDREAAREAIEKPIAKYNQLYAAKDQPIHIEPALVEVVLDQVKTGQFVLGEAGRGAIAAGVNEDAGAQIETPFLQLVMTRLWQEEMHASSRTLRRETLSRLGGAKRIVETHLDKAMSALSPDEQRVASLIFQHLVTRSRTKIAYPVLDLAEEYHLKLEPIISVVEKLSSGENRILRPVAPPLDQPDLLRYEISHDVLATAILDWRARYMQEQDKAEAKERAAKEAAELEREAFRQRELEQTQTLAREQQRRAEEQARAARLMRRLLVLLLIVSLLAGTTAQFAFVARKKAQQQADEAAKAQKLATEAQRLAKQRYENIKNGIHLKQAALSNNPEETRAALESELVNNQIIFRVTAECTGRHGWQGKLVYLFKLFPKADSIPGGPDSIASITYKMDHPSFLIDEGLRNTLFLTGQDTNFTFSYYGWGGITQVIAVIEYTDPDTAPTITSFDMRERIGEAWPAYK